MCQAALPQGQSVRTATVAMVRECQQDLSNSVVLLAARRTGPITELTEVIRHLDFSIADGGGVEAVHADRVRAPLGLVRAMQQPTPSWGGQGVLSRSPMDYVLPGGLSSGFVPARRDPHCGQPSVIDWLQRLEVPAPLAHLPLLREHSGQSKGDGSGRGAMRRGNWWLPRARWSGAALGSVSSISRRRSMVQTLSQENVLRSWFPMSSTTKAGSRRHPPLPVSLS